MPQTYRGVTIPAYGDSADAVVMARGIVDTGGGCPRFASGTARNSALTSPAEGQMAYLADVNQFTVFDGAQWVDMGTYMVPVGTIHMWAGASGALPTGYLLCDGTVISSGTYPQLAAIIGSTFGAANKLPDLRGRHPLGAGSGAGLTVRTLGQSLGAEVLTTAQLPSHSHGGATGGESNGHNHAGWNGTESYVMNAGSGGFAMNLVAGPFVARASTHWNNTGHTHGINAEGSGATHTHPSVVVNFMVRAA